MVDANGSFPIHLYPFDPRLVRKQADLDIEFAAIDEDDSCADWWHSERCQIRMDHTTEPCIQLQAERARRRKVKLESLYMLKKCVQRPESADSERTFEGMAMDSCIFDMQ